MTLNEIVYNSSTYKVYGLSTKDNPDLIRYIGITKFNLEKRLKEHLNYSKSNHNKRANWIKKHKDIVITEIESELTREEAIVKEIEYIKTFKSLGANLVNSTSGGDGVRGFEPSLETRLKQSQAKINNPVRYWKGKKRGKIKGFGEGRKAGYIVSEETKDKIRIAHMGKKLSKDHIEKMRLSKLGTISLATRKSLVVTDLTFNETFTVKGVKQLSEILNCNKRSIANYFKNNSLKPFKNRYVLKYL